MRFAAFFCLASAMGFAGRWEGVLVDSKCYDTMEQNVNPGDAAFDAGRDRNLEVRYCRANARTKSFTVVRPDGLSFKLDSRGNTKAVEIVGRGNPKFIFVVNIVGEVHGEAIDVDSIALLRNVPP